MTTTPTTFPRVKSAGLQGAKVVGREQLTKISASHESQKLGKGGASGAGKAKGSNERTPLRKK
jgi:hypothetical protein